MGHTGIDTKYLFSMHSIQCSSLDNRLLALVCQTITILDKLNITTYNHKQIFRE